jgi:HNH endonuclease
VLIVIAQEGSNGIDRSGLLGGTFDGLRPFVPLIIIVILLIVILTFPLPGRGPGILGRRDPWRSFKFEARRVVLARAGNRCEGPILLAWGRCRKPAEEVDHVYPWSKGGATVVGNGQAPCKSHNRSKSNFTPPWWYVLSLERRRRKYYPAGAIVRVSGAMPPSDRTARAAWSARTGTDALFSWNVSI